MNNVHFLTVSNQKYYRFVIPYIAAALETYKQSTMEIYLDDKIQFEKTHKPLISIARNHFGSRWALRQIPAKFLRPQSKVSPIFNSLRWVVAPKTRQPLTYIGDIDILILRDTKESLGDIHRRIMKETRLPYSNMLRRTGRMTGLHCVDTKRYFDKIDIEWIGQEYFRQYGKMSDEELICRIVTYYFGKITPNRERPVHGIHLSPNRRPGNSAMHWGVNKARANAYLVLSKTDSWGELLPYFDKAYLSDLKILDEIIAKKKHVD